MIKYLHLQNTCYLKQILLMLLLFLAGLTTTLQAEELTIEPATPTVPIECSIQLTVLGASGKIVWLPEEGKIQGKGNKVTYIAPKKVGEDFVIVADKSSKNSKSVKINVVELPPDGCPKTPIEESGNAVILIHSSKKGNNNSIQIEEHIFSTGVHIYKTLIDARFYQDDEIYITPFKSPYNLTLEEAFEKAKQQSNKAKAKDLQEEPLVVIFIGDGLPDNLVLTSSDDLLSEQTLKGLLDGYQKATGNTVVVMIDAPYSGTLIDALKDDNRLIITSTDDTEHNTSGINSFIVAYFSQLAGGSSYGKALEFVTDNIELNQQPQLEESKDLAQTLCLNNCFYGLPGPVITIQGIGNGDIIPIPDGTPVITPSETVQFETPLVNDALVIDAIVEHPQLSTLTIPLERKADGQWHYSYYGFTVPGYYTIRFKIQKNDFSVVETSPVTLSVINRTTLIDNILHVPVAVPTGYEGQDIYYHAQLIQKAGSNTLFELDSSRLNIINNHFSVEIVRYDPATGGVYIPRLDMPNESKSANLQLIFPVTEPMQFELRF